MLPQTYNNSVESAADDPTNDSKRVLEPTERISEVLFGLIVVLTFTCTIKAKNAGQVHPILIQALGCTLAWAIIDAGFYLVGRLGEGGRKLLLLRQVRQGGDQNEARRTIERVLPPLIASHLHSDAFDWLRQELVRLPEPPARPQLTKQDWKGALGVFLFASVAIFPVSIPFIFMSDAGLALFVSHGIAVLLLFMAGWALGRHTSAHPLRVGVGMVLFGFVMIAIALALGG